MSIWRVAVGSLALGGTIIPCLGKVAVTAGRYSQRRFVAGGGSFRVPIIQFKTQQAPILAALSQSFVLKAFFSFATRLFSDDSADFRVRHGIAASFKVIAVRHGQDANLALSERCGAQGLFGHNGISELHVSGYVYACPLWPVNLDCLSGRYEGHRHRRRRSSWHFYPWGFLFAPSNQHLCLTVFFISRPCI